MSLKFLIVDDYPEIIMSMKEIIKHIMTEFNNQDFNIFEFNSVRNFIVDGEFSYDIAIIDWNIGIEEGEKGNAVIDKIKSKTPHICIYTGMFNDVGNITKYANRVGALKILKGGKESYTKIYNFIQRAVSDVLNYKKDSTPYKSNNVTI